MKASLVGLGAAVALASLSSNAGAVPPPAATAVTAVRLDTSARWIRHRVIPGERLAEIAERHGVAVDAVLEWNDLDAKRLMLRVGSELKIFTATPAPPRERLSYVVRSGDSWAKIARRFGVEQDRLRKRWNADQAALKAGDRVTLWIDAEPEPPSAGSELGASGGSGSRPKAPAPALPSVAATGLSVGSPGRGRLVGGVQIPAQEQLYTLRNVDHSWGSSHAVRSLQRGLADFRQSSGFDRELVVLDMSLQRGGRFRPHHSHTSGRDVDIRLPLRRGIAAGTIPRQSSVVDWDAAWALVHALIRTGEVRYVFLARSRQAPLYKAAVRAGVSADELERLIQYPRRSRIAVVRHSAGHIKHVHVRFKCAPHETECIDL
jgi:murein endopeptidase/LysM repeat protein